MELRHETTYNGEPVTVVAGWDPMLNRFWTIVEPVDELNPDADEESGMIYSNLDDPEVPEARVAVNLDYYREKMAQLGIDVPREFFDKVYAANS